MFQTQLFGTIWNILDSVGIIRNIPTRFQWNLLEYSRLQWKLLQYSRLRWNLLEYCRLRQKFWNILEQSETFLPEPSRFGWNSLEYFRIKPSGIVWNVLKSGCFPVNRSKSIHILYKERHLPRQSVLINPPKNTKAKAVHKPR